MFNSFNVQSLRTRIVVSAAGLAVVASSFVGVQLVGAQGVQWTGPGGEQCHIKQQGGDFVGPDNNDTANNGNISMSPTYGNADGNGPFMTPAGCELAPPVNMPPPPPVAATPVHLPNGVSVTKLQGTTSALQ